MLGAGVPGRCRWLSTRSTPFTFPHAWTNSSIWSVLFTCPRSVATPATTSTVTSVVSGSAAASTSSSLAATERSSAGVKVPAPRALAAAPSSRPSA